MPRLSKQITRAKEERRSKNRAAWGSSPTISRWLTKPGTKIISTGPSPIVV